MLHMRGATVLATLPDDFNATALIHKCYTCSASLQNYCDYRGTCLGPAAEAHVLVCGLHEGAGKCILQPLLVCSCTAAKCIG